MNKIIVCGIFRTQFHIEIHMLLKWWFTIWKFSSDPHPLWRWCNMWNVPLVFWLYYKRYLHKKCTLAISPQDTFTICLTFSLGVFIWSLASIHTEEESRDIGRLVKIQNNNLIIWNMRKKYVSSTEVHLLNFPKIWEGQWKS